MKKLVFLATIVVLIIIICNFSVSIYQLWHKKDLLLRAEQQLQQEKRENQKLKIQLKKVQSQAFVEEQARDNLFLAKPGESTILIPSSLLAASPSAAIAKKEEKPTWQQWWEVFFARN